MITQEKIDRINALARKAKTPEGLTAEDTVLFLLSGGGSALFESPLIPAEELAQLTSALLACGLPAFEAAACAVYLHGAAADRAAALHGETGMLPHDLLDALGTLFAENGR